MKKDGRLIAAPTIDNLTVVCYCIHSTTVFFAIVTRRAEEDLAMDKELFLRKLSLAARWRLPWGEAEEVIQDYRELLADSGGEDFGDPVQAVRLLERPKEYRRWLTVFVLLAVAALAAPVSGLYNLPFDLGVVLFLPVLGNLWSFFYQNQVFLAGLPLLGMALAWGWFRRHGVKPPERAAFRRVCPLLAVELLFLAGAWALFCLAAALEFSAGDEILAFLDAYPWSVRILRLFLVLGGPLCGGLGVWGLVRARTRDRRWLAVYLLGVTAAGLCAEVLALFSGMSMEITASDWWVSYARVLLDVTAAGLLGTGWALC